MNPLVSGLPGRLRPRGLLAGGLAVGLGAEGIASPGFTCATAGATAITLAAHNNPVHFARMPIAPTKSFISNEYRPTTAPYNGSAAGSIALLLQTNP